MSTPIATIESITLSLDGTRNGINGVGGELAIPGGVCTYLIDFGILPLGI